MPKAIAGPEIERLIQLLARLPGLGPRSARRAALFLIKKREPLMAPLTVSGLDETLPHVWSAPRTTLAEIVCAPVPACTVIPPSPSVRVLAPPTVTAPVAPAAKFTLRTERS